MPVVPTAATLLGLQKKRDELTTARIDARAEGKPTDGIDRKLATLADEIKDVEAKLKEAAKRKKDRRGQ
jgi:hypothetical protein